MNEELGISEYKALVASYRAEIAQLKLSVSARKLDVEGVSGTLSPVILTSEANSIENKEEVEMLKYKILELTTELESEKTLVTTHKMTINSMQADVNMNNCLIKELEDKLFKVIICECMLVRIYHCEYIGYYSFASTCRVETQY